MRSQNFKIDIQDLESSYTQLEQLRHGTCIISGGLESNGSRFDIVSNKQVQKFNMLISRRWHRTVYDQKQFVYILAGCLSSQSEVQINQCEIFNYKTKEFQIIESTPTKVSTFGSSYAFQRLVIIAGYSKDIIQIYDIPSQQWSISEVRTSERGSANASYDKVSKEYYYWARAGTLNFTYVTDLKQTCIHGGKYIGNQAKYDIIQPIMFQSKIYIFDSLGVLCFYDLNEAQWNKVGIPDKEEQL